MMRLFYNCLRPAVSRASLTLSQVDSINLMKAKVCPLSTDAINSTTKRMDQNCDEDEG